MPVKGYFRAMKAVCEKYGALLILDEVMCGMGRTGMLHAWEHGDVDVVPDLAVVGKGLGAGYVPISAVMVNARLVDAFQASGKGFAHGQTYMAHPQAAAAGLAVQRAIRNDNLLENVRAMGAVLERTLKATLLPHPHVGDIRGCGLFWAVEFVVDKQSKTPFPESLELHAKMHARGMAKGYEIALFNANGACDGYTGDHFLICPPFIVTEDDVNEIGARTTRVVEDTFDELVNSVAWEKVVLEMEVVNNSKPVVDVAVGESELVTVE